ncbi:MULTISPECIES: MAPEG family protein [unclassified Caballeronia]|uniref:MAPEG family protein n=1 Tax=unclassified Caballeronia TaxID=2646786 RepID=UPI002861C81E|nr:MULTISPECIES: MAPEG family protein [unclassified Caballeronia]MDR5783327.1 MAPEG family protein [Caballeronia sp. LZ065]MDR5817742.1 MAPEG family protein [Caballeronia sp. LZ033]MDR5824683.1 MAPEG family protein [Caballeronia sp. LZ043]MDR5882578.1 MAPEG family protein [Caballeronia sp. LZ032]
MSFELTMLAWTLVLALVQVLLPAFVRSREVGLRYNAGPRDAPARPPGRLSGRLLRAQTNLFETLPIFAIAVLIVHVTGRENVLTHYGALAYFVARLVYVPLYVAGVPFVRSLVWLVSIVGIVQILVPIV